MAHDDSPAGFLSRWSRRKADARLGVVDDAAEPVSAPVPAVPPASASAQPHATPAASQDAAHHAATTAQAAPTLRDVDGLTPASDFTGFVARGVTPEVKNAAMKKLFADPHFNVMDGMDVYIDDYSVASPLSAAVLRQMNGAKLLNLFDDEAAVAQSAPTDPDSKPEPSTHDHADLRLQQDPAPEPQGPGPKPA